MELENVASVKPAPDYEYFFNVGLPRACFQSLASCVRPVR